MAAARSETVKTGRIVHNWRGATVNSTRAAAVKTAAFPQCGNARSSDGGGPAFCPAFYLPAGSGIMSGLTVWCHCAVMNLSRASTTSTSADISAVRCPNCRRTFDCGARGDRAGCWCMSMPSLPAAALDASSGCLCPECLAAAIARNQAGASPE